MKKLFIILFLLVSCDRTSRVPASNTPIEEAKSNFQQYSFNIEEEEREPDQFHQDLESLQELVPQILSYRSSSLELFKELNTKIEDNEPLSALDVQNLLTLNVERDKISKSLTALLDDYRYALSDYSFGAYRRALRKNEDSWIFSRVHFYLAVKLLIDDNYITEAALYQNNTKLRRLLNEKDKSYNLGGHTLFQTVDQFFSEDNVQIEIKAMKIYEKEGYPSDSFLTQLIQESQTYKLYRDELGPNTFAGKIQRWLDGVKQTRVTIGDLFYRLKEAVVAKVSSVIGLTFMQIRWLDGALYQNRPVIEEIIANMKPLDILSMKIRNKMTGRFVPGFWGHIALWLGTEEQLQEMGVWDQLPRSVQKQVSKGNSLLDGGKKGVILTNMDGYYFNIDDVAILRYEKFTPEEHKEAILRAVAQLGKKYDYNMDSESSSKLVCSEVAFVTYSMINFERGEFMGKTTAPPTEIAYEATPGRTLEPILLYVKGEKIEGDLKQHMLSLHENGNIYIKRPDNLPEVIDIKTDTETFTHQFDFALREGRIWFRVNQRGIIYDKSELNKNVDLSKEWELLGPMGLPFDRKGNVFNQIDHIKAISADGDNLIAISDRDTVYYTKVYSYNWKKKWGMPIPATLNLPDGHRSFGISHRGPYMKYFSDIDDNKHYVKAGVTTLYVLDENGDKIYYADPWLPPKFIHQVPTPLNGRFIAKKMSVSGSTLFLINEAGEMYTRLYDFDTSGQNPVLAYSYEREHRVQADPEKDKTWVTRTLPPEGWLKQPSIEDGRITDTISIFQTGEQGNSAFELRVEGKNGNDESGYFYKKIYDTQWSFVASSEPIRGEFLDPSLGTALAPEKTQNYSGLIKRFLKRDKIYVQLRDFNIHGEAATLRFFIHDQTIDNEFHIRRLSHKRSGKITARGTLVLSPEFTNSNNSYVKRLYRKLFSNQPIVDFIVQIRDRQIKARENLHILGIDKVSDSLMSITTGRERGGELHSKLHFPVKMYLSNFEDEDDYIKSYLSQLNFGDVTSENRCRGYDVPIQAWIDDSPFEDDNNFFYLNIGSQDVMKMKVEFRKLEKELSKINLSEISSDHPIIHKVRIYRPEAPSNDVDNEIYEKIFGCRFFGCKRKIDARLYYDGENYRLYDHDGIRQKNQLDLLWEWKE